MRHIFNLELGEIMLIDTLQFSIPLEAEHIYNFQMKFGGESFKEVLNSQGIHGIKIFLFKKAIPIRISVFVDCKFILRKQILIESDYWRLEKYLLKALDILFDDDSLFDAHTLTRLDYSFDVEVEGEKNTKILLEILKLQTLKYRRIKLKETFEDGLNFDTESESIEVAIYDKTVERGQKCDNHVLRCEVRLKNDHLYNFTKRKKVKKKIRTFFSLKIFKFYMEEYLFKILYKGNYYSMNAAIKIINNTTLKELEKEREKEKIISLLFHIATDGVDATKCTMCAKTFRKRINLLGDLKINPFTIEDNIDIEYLEGVYSKFLKAYEASYS